MAALPWVAVTVHTNTHTSTDTSTDAAGAIEAMLSQRCITNWVRGLTGDQRRRIRDDAGLSRAAVARALGVTESAIRSWEAGYRAPGPRHGHDYGVLLSMLQQKTSCCPTCGRAA